MSVAIQGIYDQLLKCKITEFASTHFLSDTIGNPRSIACFLLVGGRFNSLQLLKEEIKKCLSGFNVAIHEVNDGVLTITPID